MPKSPLKIFKEIFLNCFFFLSFIVFVLQLYNFTGNSPLVSAPIIPATQTQDPMKPPLVEAVPMASCPMYSMKSGMHWQSEQFRVKYYDFIISSLL